MTQGKKDRYIALGVLGLTFILGIFCGRCFAENRSPVIGEKIMVHVGIYNPGDYREEWIQVKVLEKRGELYKVRVQFMDDRWCKLIPEGENWRWA